MFAQGNAPLRSYSEAAGANDSLARRFTLSRSMRSVSSSHSCPSSRSSTVMSQITPLFCSSSSRAGSRLAQEARIDLVSAPRVGGGLRGVLGAPSN